MSELVPTGSTTVRRLLVANRAEIASRVFRTCRTLGIGTVAVHSDADAALPYVAEADVSVRLPGDSPADTYLRADLLVEAARAALVGLDVEYVAVARFDGQPTLVLAVRAGATRLIDNVPLDHPELAALTPSNGALSPKP